MNINIKLNKNFVTQFNKLQEKYGDEFTKLNGLDDDKLSFTDFINGFIDSDNVANASIDANANVGHKDIVSLINEMSKPHQKLLAYNKLYYEIQKKYGFKTANAWLEAEWNKALYLHDAHSASFVSYCYKGEEMLSVRYKGNKYNLTFVELYKLIEEPEQFDESILQDAKFPHDLWVKDIDENENVVWTKLTRIVKHDNTKPMRFIKYANGISQIVTEDHPIITSDGEVPAIDVTTEHTVFSVCPEIDKVPTDEIYNKEFGWIAGMCLSEGSAQPSVIHLKQSEVPQREYLIYLLNKYDMPFSLGPDDTIRIKSSPREKILEHMLLGKTAAFKALPINYLDLPSEFLDGVVAGMIDGDGTIGSYKHRNCQIRIASEELCHQLSTYLKSVGVFCGDRTPYIYNGQYSFKQSLPLFGIAFTLTNEDYFMNIGSIKINTLYEPRVRKTGNFMNKKYQYNYGWVNIIENTEYIDQCPIVYDITTETGHFICNNILSHNCYAYDLKDLAERGLYFIPHFNAEAPKHLESFIDMVKEHCSYTCNRSAGAVAYPNLIPYMWYFWKQDVKNNYVLRDPETYAVQQIQRLIYSLNQPFLRGGIQSAFTNVNFFDHPYFEAIFGGSEFPDGTFMIDAEEEIIEFQKKFLTVMSEIRHHNMMTYPVSTISLLTTEDGDFVDEEFAKWACEHNREWNDSNWFVDSSVTSLSSCCRLRNDINELSYFNSIGGAALKVGSIKVSTINLARIAYEHPTEQEYLVALRDITELNLKALDCQRHIIKRNVEKGLLPNFSHNLVDFQNSYSSLGLMGIFETMKSFGYTRQDEFGNTYYSDKAFSFGKRIFEVIHNVKDAFVLDKDYHVNLEAVPGESAAVKFQKADEMLYPEKVVKDLPLYGNQWIPLGIKTTIPERVRIAAAFSEYCSGGDILHIGVDAPFDTFDKAWDMLRYVAKKGVKYFAFTGKISACAKNHAYYGDVCPICGGRTVTTYSRIVGFFTPDINYSEPRHEEWEMRQWDNVNKVATEVAGDVNE